MKKSSTGKTSTVDFSDKRPNLPLPPAPATAYSHHHHHECLEISANCPQHGGYVFCRNSHHHLQLSHDCPLHGHLLPHCPLHTTSKFPPNPNFNSQPPLMMQQRNKQVEEEEEDEEEIIFELTDEWKEFFAKSEAKRRLAKKQAKKKGKD